MIFGKKSKNKSVPGKEEILENIYKLGFEVGYFHHSEVGWVSRKYKELYDLAKANAKNIDVEKYYQAAKQDGREKRQKDITKGYSEKPENFRSEPHEKVEITSTQTDTESAGTPLSGKSVGPIDFNSPVEKPELESIPSAIKKGTLLNAPKFLR
jgi:hypothetical protein